MASLPPVKKITKEDLRDAPSWVTYLLNPLNTFMESVYSALDSNLTLGDNISADIVTISFKTRSDYGTTTPLTDGWEVQKVKSTTRYRPKSVVVGGIVDKEKFSTITSNIFVHWEFLNGFINIKYITGLEASKKYEVNLLIF
jgi:hypothetical protein